MTGFSGFRGFRDTLILSPRAILEDSGIAIELHEYGPMLDFVVQHVDQIPNYVSALAAVVSAWAAVRTLRRQQLPKDDNRREGGTVMTIGGLRVEHEYGPMLDFVGTLTRFRTM